MSEAPAHGTHHSCGHVITDTFGFCRPCGRYMPAWRDAPKADEPTRVSGEEVQERELLRRDVDQILSERGSDRLAAERGYE